MKIEDALKKAKEIDGDTYVDCQELVIDIYNQVEEVIFKELAEENKRLHSLFKNEQENNIDSEMAKSIIIDSQRNAIKILTENQLMPNALIAIAKQDKKVNHYNKELDITFTIQNGYRL